MSRLLLSLADWRCGFNPHSILPSLEDSQFWPQDRLEQQQVQRLRKLLVHAGEHVPFYRDLFSRIDFNPHAIASVADIGRLPVLSKPDITDEVNAFISDIAKKPLVWLQTSGTTGQPFRFARTRLAQSYKIASRIRFRRWYDIERNSPLLNVGGISSYEHSIREKISHALHFFATKRIEVFSSDLEGPGKEHAAQLIEKHRLKAVMGYPSGIASLAQYLQSGRKLAYAPSAVFTNAETLTDLMRIQIREGFGVEPRADYVATEGAVAHECPHGSLHVNMEEALLELLPTGNPDGGGEVVVTFLHTFDFPLIRYRLGDIASWAKGSCSCGRGLQVIEKLLGRSSDGIKIPDGRTFTAANINMRIAHFPFAHSINQYQIIQISKRSIELRVLHSDGISSEIVEKFKKALEDMFPGLVVQARIVNTLARGPAGKFRPIIGLAKAEPRRQDV